MNTKHTAHLAMAKRRLSGCRLLLENGLGDIAVTEAYFAMFDAATAWLLGEGKTFKTHRGLLNGFALSVRQSERLPRELSSYLRQAFEARLTGHYHATHAIDESVARRHVANAERFVAEVEAALSDD